MPTDSVDPIMAKFLLKGFRYVKCYCDLALGKPRTLEETVDYCVDRPILMAQVRCEIAELGRILQAAAPKRSLEIGTNYGGTLLLLCRLSPPDAKIISVDLPSGRFGGGYPRRKALLFRRFPKSTQRLHLIRADSHSPKTKEQVLRILGGEPLDYLFLDGDHTYDGVKHDFQMYAPIVRSGGMVAFHDIVVHKGGTDCEVSKFWTEIKQRYRYREIVADPSQVAPPIAITGSSMDTSGLGLLFMP